MYVGHADGELDFLSIPCSCALVLQKLLNVGPIHVHWRDITISMFLFHAL